MNIQALFHRYFPGIYLLLLALLGFAGGWLCCVLLSGWVAPQAASAAVQEKAVIAAPQRQPLSNFEVILARNVFDSSAQGTGSLAAVETQEVDKTRPAPRRQASQARRKLTLIGTVAAEHKSLAVIQEGRDVKIYRLGEEVPGGGTLDEVGRNFAIIQYRDGSRETLTLTPEMATAATAAEPSPAPAAAQQAESPYSIRAIGENQWVIPKESAEAARSNLNELLRQSRMEPRIVNGQTQGFIVRMIRPNTFLDMLGIQRGDILLEINDINLDSPEKALQIFQQLREATRIDVGLLRGGQRMTFEYEID